MSKRFITMKDVAKASGVSLNTVSRAFNDKADINEETKKNVLSVAEGLGYVKNASASLLRKKHTKIFGVIVSDNTNPFSAELVKAIERRAHEVGYQMILMNTDRVYENEKNAIKTILERRVDGLIITPVQSDNSDIKALVKRNFPVVVLGRYFKDVPVDTVHNDEIKGGYLATKHLIEKGCKNILFLNHYLYKSVSQMRYEGFKKALKEYGTAFNDEMMVEIEMEIYQAYETVKVLLKKKKRIDGLFCFNDLMAMGALNAIHEAGVNVPDEIKIVGFDNIVFSGIVSPSLTTVNIDKKELGEKGFEILLERINEQRSQPVRVILDVDLVERKST
ncbi:MAG: LacI family DNA-binding transcriptional regulator [Thermotogota bacterium]|nr:LacI family DNA-binding transcriptional regulator [Thermotogota bacterium]